MPFSIHIRDDVSLLDLQRISREGGSVLKTPHVGNHYPNNLVVADLGIRMLCYDRTYGRRDMNFHPQMVIVGGDYEVLGDAEILTTHLRVQKPSQLMNGQFPVGARILECHMRELSRAIPHGTFIVYTEYLKDHIDVVLPILQVLSDAFPEVWERYVDHDGSVRKFKVRSWREARETQIYGLTSNERGLLVPNILNVLLSGVLECLDYNVSEVYHLSGPDMVKYIDTMIERLHVYYDHLCSHLSLSLPKTLLFHLVPVASMRFAVDSARSSELDNLVDAYRSLIGMIEKKRQDFQIARTENEKSALIAKYKRYGRERNDQLQQAVMECPDIFYDLRIASARFTQYDLLAGRTLYVHPWGLESPVREFAVAMGALERILDRVKYKMVA